MRFYCNLKVVTTRKYCTQSHAKSSHGEPPFFCFVGRGSTSLASATSITVVLFEASGIHWETANN
jgi:hypothetical protein